MGGRCSGEGRKLFESNLETIERVVASTCRRYSLSGEEAEDFRSSVFVRLLEDDRAVLRKFRGGSSLTTFLAVVVGNLARDWRIAEWGRYRPSRAAERLGVTAVRLEILLHRDGYGFDEAVRLLRKHHGVRESDRELASLAGRLHRQPRPRFDAPMPAVDPSHEPDPDRGLLAAEQRERAARIAEVLRRQLAALEAEDRLLLRLYFVEGITVASMARAFRRKQRRLYTRIETILRTLRRALEAQGLVKRHVIDVLRADPAQAAAGGMPFEGLLAAVLAEAPADPSWNKGALP